ncbi:MAG: Na+/H+ antiporter NhaA [Gammaproteobacteria bacterium]
MQLTTIRKFLKLESASGLILFVAAVMALLISNSPFAHFYQTFVQLPIKLHFGDWHSDASLLFWVNDGLMTLFFLLVGLELKREFLMGELAKKESVILPGIAALGGMLVPAMIYAVINFHHPESLRGWAIPVATDIAFALGVLSLFGKRVPLGLKLFLMALAIFDDVGAIIIIAVFHTASVSYIALLLVGLAMMSLWLLNRCGVRLLWPFLLVGFLLWVCVLKTGVHPTLAGVLLAFFIPLRETTKPLQRLENHLHPWAAYLVMPLFAFVNAGLSFQGMTISSLGDVVPLGIIAGLFLGKQLGVFGFSWMIIKLGFARLPADTSWQDLYGTAVLCGIGFTMSLFLGTLAFEYENPGYMVKVRLGVLLGSLLSGVIGASILFMTFHTKKRRGLQT